MYNAFELFVCLFVVVVPPSPLLSPLLLSPLLLLLIFSSLLLSSFSPHHLLPPLRTGPHQREHHSMPNTQPMRTREHKPARAGTTQRSAPRKTECSCSFLTRHVHAGNTARHSRASQTARWEERVQVALPALPGAHRYPAPCCQRRHICTCSSRVGAVSHRSVSWMRRMCCRWRPQTLPPPLRGSRDPACH